MSFIEIPKTGQAYRVLTAQDTINDINTYDKLSFWTAASDVEFDNHSTLQDMGGTFCYASGQLNKNSATVTITGNNITEDGLLDVYVPDEYCKLTPDSIERTAGSVTITFPYPRTQVEENIEVRVVCKDFRNIAPPVGGG